VSANPPIDRELKDACLWPIRRLESRKSSELHEGAAGRITCGSTSVIASAVAGNVSDVVLGVAANPPAELLITLWRASRYRHSIVRSSEWRKRRKCTSGNGTREMREKERERETERGPPDARGGRVITMMKMHEEKLREAIKRTKKQRWIETVAIVGFYKKRRLLKEERSEKARQDLNEVSAHAAVLPVSPPLSLSVLFHLPSSIEQRFFLSLLVLFALNRARANLICACALINYYFAILCWVAFLKAARLKLISHNTRESRKEGRE